MKVHSSQIIFTTPICRVSADGRLLDHRTAVPETSQISSLKQPQEERQDFGKSISALPTHAQRVVELKIVGVWLEAACLWAISLLIGFSATEPWDRYPPTHGRQDLVTRDKHPEQASSPGNSRRGVRQLWLIPSERAVPETHVIRVVRQLRLIQNERAVPETHATRGVRQPWLTLSESGRYLVGTRKAKERWPSVRRKIPARLYAARTVISDSGRRARSAWLQR